MTIELGFAVTIAAAIVAGWLIAWLVLRSRVLRAFESGRAALAPELQRLSDALGRQQSTVRSLDEQLALKEQALRQAEEARNDAGTQLAVCEQKNHQIPELKAAIGERDRQLQQLHAELNTAAAELAAARERTSRHQILLTRLQEREQTIDAIRQDLSQKEAEVRELNVRMGEERKQAEEKLALLQEARQELANQFRVLAQEIFEEKGRAFGEQSRAGLKGLIDPFREQLNEFKRKVDDVYVHEARERAGLKQEIETLRNLNQQISQEAVNLTRALKGDKKALGTWGELILERVLEKSGLRNGVEYETQATFRDADGNLLRPDVIVHLPDDKCVVIDSKLSLVAYERCANAETEAERKMALAAHVQAVRSHIEALSGKAYTDLRGVRSLDYVLMFMPIDAAFVAAFREDEALYNHAFERHIVVVTPSTLLATLKTIENIWRYERQNRSAQDIVSRASAIYEKLRLFVESMEKLGNQINTVQGTYDEAMNRLVRGRGNVISQAARFCELGVPIKKVLPRTVMDAADLEGAAADDDPVDLLE